MPSRKSRSRASSRCKRGQVMDRETKRCRKSRRSSKRSKSHSRKGSRGMKHHGAITAYCVACRQKCKLTNYKITKARNGVPMACGHCPRCGTKCCRFMKKD